MGALTDPTVESGKGRGRGNWEGLTRTSCSLPPEQMEGLNTSTPFISSMAKSTFTSSVAPLSIFNINQDSIKGNTGPFLGLSDFILAQGSCVWWVSAMRWVTTGHESRFESSSVTALAPQLPLFKSPHP